MHGRLAILVLLCLSVAGCSALPKFVSKRQVPAPVDFEMKYSHPAGRLTMYSNFVVPDHLRVARELNDEDDDVCQTLGLPCSKTPISLFLFRDARTYAEYLSHDFPNVPSRRAFFIETNGNLAIYAHWSDRVAEDLRHEVAHGYLHSVLSNLPLWLDEGLAEFFEVPRTQGGLNQPHVDLLTDLIELNRWRPNLSRLEHLDDIAQMDQQSYAEAWAWVYFMLNSQPERREMLTHYLNNLTEPRGPAEALSVRLQKIDADPEQALVDFLAGLRKRRPNY